MVYSTTFSGSLVPRPLPFFFVFCFVFRRMYYIEHKLNNKKNRGGLGRTLTFNLMGASWSLAVDETIICFSADDTRTPLLQAQRSTCDNNGKPRFLAPSHLFITLSKEAMCVRGGTANMTTTHLPPLLSLPPSSPTLSPCLLSHLPSPPPPSP